MLAGDDNMVEPDTTTTAATATPTTTNTTTTTTTIPLKKVSLRKPANVSGSSAFVRAEDEETAPKREMILLEYTEEELQEMANQTQQFLSYTSSSSNVGDDQDQLEEVYGRKQKASVMLAGETSFFYFYICCYILIFYLLLYFIIVFIIRKVVVAVVFIFYRVFIYSITV